MCHTWHHAVHKPRGVSPKSCQKPHQRKQGDHISCRGSPGIPLLLFLLSKSHVTHCFDWQSFQRWVQGLLEPSAVYCAFLSVSLCFTFALLTLSQYVSHRPSLDILTYYIFLLSPCHHVNMPLPLRISIFPPGISALHWWFLNPIRVFSSVSKIKTCPMWFPSEGPRQWEI